MAVVDEEGSRGTLGGGVVACRARPASRMDFLNRFVRRSDGGGGSRWPGREWARGRWMGGLGVVRFNPEG